MGFPAFFGGRKKEEVTEVGSSGPEARVLSEAERMLTVAWTNRKAELIRVITSQPTLESNPGARERFEARKELAQRQLHDEEAAYNAQLAAMRRGS